MYERDQGSSMIELLHSKYLVDLQYFLQYYNCSYVSTEGKPAIKIVFQG